VQISDIIATAILLIMNSQSQNTQSTSQLKTFAETTANTQFPKKKQAIVLNTINDIPQLEYIKALGKITSTKKNIVCISYFQQSFLRVFYGQMYR